MDFGLRTLLLGGGIKALAKTDSCAWRDRNIDKYVLLVQLLLREVRWELSELGLCPIGRRLIGKFLQGGFR